VEKPPKTIPINDPSSWPRAATANLPYPSLSIDFATDLTTLAASNLLWDNQPGKMKQSLTHSPSNQVEHLALEFLSRFRREGIYLRDHITRLVETALSEDEAEAKAATRAIFTSLVEKLADSFDPAAVSLYNRVFAHVIAHCRANRRGEAIDRALNRFQLRSEDDLLARAERLRSTAGLSRPGVKLIVALSRVTLGADVAITSVIIERLKQVFPDARMALAGGGKATELFGGDPQLSFEQIDYSRSATVLDRLLNWVELLDRLRSLTEGAERDECLIVDPDSRLTQLGLLPVASPYLFFPSREYDHRSSRPLSELASLWLDEVFGAGSQTLPRVSLHSDDIALAREATRQLRLGDERPVVAINFGVGENPAKRVGDQFEKSLVADLIRIGAVVMLDRGAGEDELRRADAVIEYARSERSHCRVIELDERNLKPSLDAGLLIGADLAVWRGRIGVLASLIGQSDLYIGYDSAGQHIAAALGVPCIDVMAGYSSPRILDRWRPTGPRETRIIDASDEADALSQTMLHARELLT
jgi:ADP-heptose:LPS heptosyltransferase